MSWFQEPHSIRPIPALQELRSIVISASEKRMPKWKLRVASDVVISLQPKLTERYLLLFEGAVLMCEGANGRLLCGTKEADLPRPLRKVEFDLFARVPDEWTLKPRSWRASRQQGLSKEQQGEKSIELRDQIVVSFRGGMFDRIGPEKMLVDHCLICGKFLTDTVSKSRMIGPECITRVKGARWWGHDLTKMAGGETQQERGEDAAVGDDTRDLFDEAADLFHASSSRLGKQQNPMMKDLYQPP